MSLFISTAAIAAEAPPLEPTDVSVRAITEFHIGRDEKTFGPLEFVGGLEMVSGPRHFGGFSSFRFLKPGSDFVGVADTGFWFFGKIVHDAEGRPSGVKNFRMEAMLNAEGQVNAQKWEVDAESIAVKDGIATVGFERNHRIAQFKLEPGKIGLPFRQLDFLVPAYELRQNRGFETVTWSDPEGPLKGALVAVTEKSLDRQGNVFAAVLDGPKKGIFKVRRHPPFDITDGAFLPNGDLLLLERAFSMADGVRMRLRRIDGDAIGRGMLADGPVLLQADMAYQIDNMEGLDVWRRTDGATIVSLISDDNRSLFQRNLYLEFVLHER
ncbi:esterase-like activity of phytase family protein [Manganibacter manganicus]|uniref:Phytase-like domain-containing protein n=1 Tax=Manganibacter manganicus TaxID=1873176 RepID=A0A1V8RPH4_9HYPH|nr:esterase-like activity of phytase family protein [Pseudaminobacter manganicus]OQM75085.1 hypothetical protein BFN67_20050 [Pseudaminobacter manganicus]